VEPRATTHRQDGMRTRPASPILVVLVLLAGACSSGTGGTPGLLPPAASPTPGTLVGPTPTMSDPGPTQIPTDISSPEAAAALVIASDPRFEGAIEMTPDVIGASKWWAALALRDGAYRITLTVGWGDCPSGCINRHTWAFRVTATGDVTLLEESGDPLAQEAVLQG
jgi:hypothetical protein